ncbi:hypothetical protein BH18ACT2_BH18ACT2_15960 [soil metagenome]
MWSWIVEHQRLPMLVCLAAFIVTFVATRVITRLIRSGRGPFKNNVSESGLHVHHAIPGLMLLIAGAVAGIAVDLDSPWAVAAGLMIGIGTSLVLDEFALILHLDDVYWKQEGRISVEMVMLAVCCLGLILFGFNPFAFATNEDQTVAVLTTVGVIVVNLCCVVVCGFKGKFPMALLGAFVPVVAQVGAIRLARPRSRWAKRRYSSRKLEKAAARAARFDAMWEPKLLWIGNFVAGPPSTTEAVPAETVTPPASAPLP